MNDYERIEKVIRYLDGHYLEQPDLRTLARIVGLSEFHFHRLFSRWAGVTPKEFLQYLTAAHAKSLLRRSRNVLDASIEAGLSGPSRLHDLLISLEGVTPGEFTAGGKGLVIRYGFNQSPFGTCFIGVTDRGICHLSFLDQDGLSAHKKAVQELQHTWPNAVLQRDHAMAVLVKKIFNHKQAKGKIPIFVIGTSFQRKVWEAILNIPAGRAWSYQQVARAMGSPQASRAVGSALGKNPIGYLIPCHRVIRQTAVLGHYRWGRHRKKAILAWEATKAGSGVSRGHKWGGKPGAP